MYSLVVTAKLNNIDPQARLSEGHAKARLQVQQEGEVVAGGGEDGVDAVAVATLDPTSTVSRKKRRCVSEARPPRCG